MAKVATITPVRVNGQDWHRVRVGPFDNVREMDAVKRRVQKDGYQVPWEESGSGFTSLFEALAIDWLKEAST